MLQTSLPSSTYRAGIQVNLDVSCRFYLRYQVLGHARRERTAAHQERHLRGVLGEVQGGLSGGVAASHHVNLLAFGCLGLGNGGAVEDARAQQTLEGRY